jgi:hypothetical protein
MAGDLLGDDCLNMRNPPGDLGGFLALQGLLETFCFGFFLVAKTMQDNISDIFLPLTRLLPPHL